MANSSDDKRSPAMGLPQVRETAAAWLLVPTLYCLLSLSLLPLGYDLFHFAAEIGCVVVGMVALLVANISRRFTSSSLLVIACSGLGWVALLDFLHIGTFEGMGLLPGDTTNLTSQLWIIGRTLQALVLLAAVVFMQRNVRLLAVHAACGAYVVICLGLLFAGRFPDTFLQGQGLTPFKIISEYLVIAVLLVAAVQVQRNRHGFTDRKYLGIQCALGLMALSEICFTLYQNMADSFNVAGHLLKVFSYWFLFRALVEQTLLQPFMDRNQLLFILGERLKEMKGLNELARISQLHENDPARFLGALVEVLPAAMLHEKQARVSVTSRYGNFGATVAELPEHRCIEQPLEVEGVQAGMLRVGYPLQAELPEPLFLDEERALLALVGQRVSALLGRQQNHDTIQQLNRLYRMLSGVNRAVVHSSSQSHLLWEVFSILRDSQGVSLAGIAERNQAQENVRITHGHRLGAGDGMILAAELQTLADGLWAGGDLRKPAPALLDVHALAAAPALVAAMADCACTQVALVPFTLHGSLLGLVLAGAPSGRCFQADEQKLLDEMGMDISFALSHLRQGQRLLEAEERVEDSERRYAVVFNQSPVPMTLMDATAQRVLAVNLAYKRWLGAPLCDITDVREWFSRVIVEPERAESLMQQLADNAGRSFAPFGYYQFPETRLHDSMGTPLVATARLTSVQDRILVVFNDITQLKEKEQRLRESEERFRNMIEETLIGVIVVQDGLFVYVNPAFCALTGWDAATLLHARLDAYARRMEPGEAGLAPAETTLHVSTQRVFEFQRKDGSSLKLFAAVSSLPWNEGIAEVMIVQDITEKVRYEQQLRESSALLENLAQQVPGVIYQFRLYPDGRSCFPYATRNLWDIYEVQPEAVKDDAAPVYARLHPDDIGRITAGIAASGRDLSVWQDDYRVVLPQQGLRWRSGFARPQRLVDGSTLWHGFIEDSTARKEMEQEVERSNRMLQRSVSGTLEIISRMMDQRDPYTAGHQHRVGQIARLIGADLGLDRQTQELLELTGVVHDVGKIAVPTEILTKPTHLTDIELRIVRGHASAGHEIVKGTNLPRSIVDAIHQHHERLDGSGYPQGLKGEQICLEARIIAVADVLESMLSHRPYRPSLGIDRAVQELQGGRGTIYDSAVVDVALKIVREQRLPASESAIH